MSSKEFKLRKLLEDSTFYIKNAQEDETYVAKCDVCMDEAEKLILENPRESLVALSSEVIVMFIEVALLSGKRDESASRVNDIFFQRIGQMDQFYCRALLAKAAIEERKIKQLELKGDENLKKVNYAFSFIRQAIEICSKPENKQKYQFVIYNASIKTWHIIRGLMRNGWSKNLVEFLEKISNMLEEVDDFDFNWRCRYLNALVRAMFDAEKKPEALKVLDKLVDLTKKKGNCNFQESLFRNRIHYYRDNNAALQNIKKETETGPDPLGLKYLFMIQQIKSGIILDPQVEKELMQIMMMIAPGSVQSGDSNLQTNKISVISLDRLAECGRIAVKNGSISLAEGAVNIISRSGQASLRAQIWTEYTKAQLILRRPPSDIDPLTGMKLNSLQIQMEDFERRVEALKILDRAMIANKRLSDPDIIIEGCYIIWNMAHPLLKNSTRQHVYKPFLSASQALAQIDANENRLRINIHLELALYEIKQDFLAKAIQQLKKCLDIDYSLTLKEIQVEVTEDDNPADFQRPLDKLIKFLLKKLDLRTNLYGGDPETVHDQIILDVENSKTTRNKRMRETLLDKALRSLQEYQEPQFKVDKSKDLVTEEVDQEKKKHKLKMIKEKKERVLIATEMAKLAYEEELNQLALDSASIAVKEKWDPIKNNDLIIAQSEAHLVLAKCYSDKLLDEDIEVGYKDFVLVDGDQEDRDFTNEDKARFLEWKSKFVEHVTQSIKMGVQSRQTWLIFNGSIEFWNSYISVFKQMEFFDKIYPQGVGAMAEAFEGMNNCFENANFSHNNVDYELAKKMQIFTNLAIMLARQHEFNGKNDEAVRICDILLHKQLPSQLRKAFDSLKARVTKQVVQPAGQTKQPPPAKGKGQEVVQPVVEVSKADQISAEVVGYLELIRQGNKDMIQKAMDTLNHWTPNEQQEIELEVNAELWCKLGRLAIAQNVNSFTKISLYCAEMAIQNADQKVKQKDYSAVPVTRLRWYSVAECLYGEALYKLMDPKKQEKESQDKLLHSAVTHFVRSCNIAAKAQMGFLLIENCKSMWNALIGILDSPNNRILLIKPLSQVHSYLKEVKENSDPDFLQLFYAALFMCIQDQKDWKLGEKIVEEAFTFVPQTHQKVLWEANMNFLSKLGKNVLNAISNMKDSNPSLMAKVWVKLARSSSLELEQHSAYNKAIEILRKEESVEVVEVLIEYAEWMHRRKYSSVDVEDQLLLAVDILMDIEPGWDEDEDDAEDDEDRKTRKTRQSRSSKMSKSKMGKSKAGGKSLKKSVADRSKLKLNSKRAKSMRSTGTKNSKKTKTAMSQRQEEEGQPSFLNCVHYDKLIRIHSMLATISHDSAKQREYALDAHFFVMKLWEQSFLSLNAQLFFEKHRQIIEELGFSQDSKESRMDFYCEILTNNEIQIPQTYSIPEKPEDWIGFKIDDVFLKKAETHEDRVMVSKFSFLKPELTLFHLQNLLQLLEDHYFSIQQLPVLQLIILYHKIVVKDSIQLEATLLQRARLLMNLGLKTQSNELVVEANKMGYTLGEEERKTNFEKVKGLKDPKDDLKKKSIPFEKEEEGTPFILEQRMIHNSWMILAEELLKWGHFIRAKDLLKEVNLHARILKDQRSYAKSLMLLSTVAYLEGESGSALKLDMICHKYAKDVDFMEKSIEHTHQILFEFRKLNDCHTLLDGSADLLQELKAIHSGSKSKDDGKHSESSLGTGTFHNNLSLEFALSTCYLLKAITLSAEARTLKTLEDKLPLIKQSFEQLEKFDGQLLSYGCNQSHLIKMITYAHILQTQITSDLRELSVEWVEFAQMKLERCAKVLLKVQEQLTDQMYYIGIHQDSNQSTLSLPLMRLLGVVKIKLARINTDIGVIKNSIKQGVDSQGDRMDQSQRKILDKVVATFMDAISKQIEAQNNTYDREMNRYEKSIIMLQSALNMIHKDCIEHSECLVEIARCKRLLAVNKKHLRGQWRQDALEVDEIAMNKDILNETDEAIKERNELLDQKGIDGEVKDSLIDYKQEALRAFISIIETNKDAEGKQEQDAPQVIQGKGKVEQPGVDEDKKEKVNTSFSQLADYLGEDRLQNILATFSLEYAETRGNLNKEQGFFYLALYQYAINRQQLAETFQKAASEKHPDQQRIRQKQLIQRSFSQFTSPLLPEQFHQVSKTLLEKSKPFKIINSYYSKEDLKDNLPHSSAYLVIQLSEDEQFMFCGFMTISRERKIDYLLTKLALPKENRNLLFKMVQTLAQNKLTLQRAPITIEQDLIQLENDANLEIMKLLDQIEAFFKPLIDLINPILCPEQKKDEEESLGQAANMNAKGAKADPKKDDKKAPQKPPPAKGAPKGGDQQLAAYESNLPLPASGIESLILFVDKKIESLPLESLSAFKDIPVVSRDFNLHMYMNRLKNLGHQAELHNNKGISNESLSFIIDPPQPLEAQALNLSTDQFKQMSPGAKWDGILTSRDHIPSIGEFQEKISKSHLFLYFSMTCLLHKFPPNLVADLSIFSKCRAMVIFDRMNTYKTLVDRNVLTSRHFIPNEQPLQEAELFSLCGVSSITLNHWSTKPEDNMEIMTNILKGSLQEGYYLGATAKRYWQQQSHEQGDDSKREKGIMFRANQCTYGVPLVRIV